MSFVRCSILKGLEDFKQEVIGSVGQFLNMTMHLLEHSLEKQSFNADRHEKAHV
jgi:hypothetical protein